MGISVRFQTQGSPPPMDFKPNQVNVITELNDMPRLKSIIFYRAWPRSPAVLSNRWKGAMNQEAPAEARARGVSPGFMTALHLFQPPI